MLSRCFISKKSNKLTKTSLLSITITGERPRNVIFVIYNPYIFVNMLKSGPLMRRIFGLREGREEKQAGLNIKFIPLILQRSHCGRGGSLKVD